MMDNNRLLYAWLLFSVSSLVVAGIFAFLAAMTRTPAVRLLPSADYFHISLVTHVIFAMVIWLLTFGAALWVFIPTKMQLGLNQPLGWAGFYSAAAGSGMIVLTALLGIGTPVLVDYVPVLDHPLYFAGLLFFAFGVGVTIFNFLVSVVRVQHSLESYGLLHAGVITLIAFASTFLAALSTGSSNYREIFWGPGHVLQFTYTLLMVVMWSALVSTTLGKSLNPRIKNVFTLYTLFALPAPLFYLLPVKEQTELFTSIMSWGLSIPTMVFAILVLKSLKLRNLPWMEPGFSSLVLSLALFGVGGYIAAVGLESNTRVPAHYHGVVGAVTMSFMGFANYLIPFLGREIYSKRVARVQPYLYGAGLLIFILSLNWAGGYGAPRKAYAMAYSDTLFMAMNLLGVGAVIAVVGGAAFVINMLLSLMKSVRELNRA